MLVEGARGAMVMAHSPGRAEDGVEAEEAEAQDEQKGDCNQIRVPRGVQIPLVHNLPPQDSDRASAGWPLPGK